MKNIPVKINFCFMMVCIFFGGMVAFFFIHTCPANTAACTKHKQRFPVAFPHDMHMADFDCEDCHHDYDDKMDNVIDTMELYSGNEDIMCSSCHASDNKINTQEAFHRQCIGCHNEEAKMSKASVPIMCNECHRPAAMTPTEHEMIIRG